MKPLHRKPRRLSHERPRRLDAIAQPDAFQGTRVRAPSAVHIAFHIDPTIALSTSGPDAAAKILHSSHASVLDATGELGFPNAAVRTSDASMPLHRSATVSIKRIPCMIAHINSSAVTLVRPACLPRGCDVRYQTRRSSHELRCDQQHACMHGDEHSMEETSAITLGRNLHAQTRNPFALFRLWQRSLYTGPT
jgi:hypothetical protein